MKYFISWLILFVLLGCSQLEVTQTINVKEISRTVTYKEIPAPKIDWTTFDSTPEEWGENVTGVKNRFVTDKKEIALTFDLCGGDYGSGFDEELVTFLQNANVPATLFVNERWIMENEEIFLVLADDPLFHIENHGTAHAPLSIDGKQAWGISGTNSVEEVVAKIMDNHATVKERTGQEMKFFRSGTAYYDEVAVEIANVLGYEVINFDILGDAGATYSAAEVERALLRAEPGSIALLHMNQPNSGTAEGVSQAVPLLHTEGFTFVHLDDKKWE